MENLGKSIILWIGMETDRKQKLEKMVWQFLNAIIPIMGTPLSTLFLTTILSLG